LSFATETVLPLLRAIQSLKTPDFAGLGIIFYSPPIQLPVRSLGDLDAFPFPLPLVGREAVIDALANISAKAAPWHDGFHLIDSSALALTHPSQFVSPPLDLEIQPSAPPFLGARQMAAVLTSRLPGVSCVALLNTSGEAQVYQRGQRILNEDLKNEQP